MLNRANFCCRDRAAPDLRGTSKPFCFRGYHKLSVCSYDYYLHKGTAIYFYMHFGS